MITAQEALGLPSVRLTPDEEQLLNRAIDAIDKHVCEQMKLHGCVFNFPGMPPHLTTAVTLYLRLFGWECSWTPLVEEAKIKGAPPHVVGASLHLLPSREAYDAHVASKPAGG